MAGEDGFAAVCREPSATGTLTNEAFESAGRLRRPGVGAVDRGEGRNGSPRRATMDLTSTWNLLGASKLLVAATTRTTAVAGTLGVTGAVATPRTGPERRADHGLR